MDWLEKSSRHQFRWRTLSGPWVTAKKRIASKEHLVKEFQGSMPTDVYVSTSSWLDPVNLPRLKDNSRPSPILLDHLVVFDIDMRPFCERKLEAARLATLDLKNWLIQNTDLEIQHVSFSGSKGFHLVAKDPNRDLFAEPSPKLREQKVREQRKELLQRALLAGHPERSELGHDWARVRSRHAAWSSVSGVGPTRLEALLVLAERLLDAIEEDPEDVNRKRLSARGRRPKKPW